MRRSHLIPILFFFSLHFTHAQEHSSFTEVEEAINQYQFIKAAESLESLPDSLKSELTYHNLAARIYRSLGDFKQARRAYQNCMRLEPHSVQTQIAWAQLEIGAHNYDQAGKLYLNLIEQDSLNPHFYKLLAYLELKRESNLGAMAAFNKSLELSERDQEAAVQLILLYLNQQIYPQADSLIRIYKAESPDSKLIHQLELRSAFSQKQYPRVQVTSQHLLKEFGDSSLLVLRSLGIAYYHLKAYNQADTILQLALEISQEPEQIFFYLGMSKLAQNQHHLGQAYLQKAMEAGTSKSMSVYELNMALSLDEEGRYGDAISYYQSVYRQTQSPLILYYLARDYDQFYLDKNPALNYYQAFLGNAGSEYLQYQDFSRKRIAELKRIQHFKGD